MCNDKSVRAKLSRDKVAAHGASWTLHKVNLLELKAEKLKCRICEAYPDEVTAGRPLKTM